MVKIGNLIRSLMLPYYPNNEIVKIKKGELIEL